MLNSRGVAVTFASRQGCLSLSHHIFSYSVSGFPLIAYFCFNHFYYKEFLFISNFPPLIKAHIHKPVLCGANCF